MPDKEAWSLVLVVCKLANALVRRFWFAPIEARLVDTLVNAESTWPRKFSALELVLTLTLVKA